jgi:acetyl/propionyl-CoA carboxylase alpha subunit
MDKIIDAAQLVKANAIHPAYGFLSENASFAQRVIDEGFIWVGPNPNAIEQMGLKANAKKIAVSANALLGVVNVGYNFQSSTNMARIESAAGIFVRIVRHSFNWDRFLLQFGPTRCPRPTHFQIVTSSS